GGAETKVSAARVAAEAGTAVLITATTLVHQALEGAEIGTWFDAGPRRHTTGADVPVE
ncbi:MAG TPA: glutamate 5-kinase, partial [Agromyces sp.]